MGGRIIHVPRRFVPSEWGGTETTLLHYCGEQRRAGFSPEIHTSRALSSIPRETFRGIPVRRYGYFYALLGSTGEERRRLDLKAGNLVSLPLFGRLLGMRDVRVLHAHTLGRLGGEVAMAARLRQLPCVVTLHGGHFDVPAGECTTSATRRRLDCGKPFGWLFRTRKLLHLVDAVVCLGRSEFEAARTALGEERVHHMPAGVHPEDFRGGDRTSMRRRLGFDESHQVIGCIGRIDPQKGQTVLLEAFHTYSARNPQARLVLSGPITVGSYARRLRHMIEEFGLGEHVRWLPPVTLASREHRNLLAGFDVCALPSRHEPFGIVALEAWAAGLPLITSRTGGLEDLVDHDVNGLHFETGDPNALAEALSRLFGEPDLRRRLAEGGSRKVRRYSWPAVYRRLEEIYEFAQEHCCRRRAA